MENLEKVKEKINNNLKYLNVLNPNLHFFLEEDECSCSITNKSTIKGRENHSFGTFTHISLFSDYDNKKTAYEVCNSFIVGLIAGTKLLDKTAYHNFGGGFQRERGR